MSSGTKNFKRAIEYLTGPGLDVRAVVVEIAKTNPAVFCRAVESVSEEVSSAKWRREIENFLRDGKKIHAIKLYRQVTGEGLKDAKGAIDFFEQYGAWRVA